MKKLVAGDECIPFILERFPGFQSGWTAHLEYWEGEAAGLCNDMGAFTHYVCELLAAREPPSAELRAIFEMIEDLMVRGDEEVKDAVATCFLENLQNSESAGRIKAESFVPLLGKESRAYCRAWDAFTGTKTPGL